MMDDGTTNNTPLYYASGGPLDALQRPNISVTGGSGGNSLMLVLALAGVGLALYALLR